MIRCTLCEKVQSPDKKPHEAWPRARTHHSRQFAVQRRLESALHNLSRIANRTRKHHVPISCLGRTKIRLGGGAAAPLGPRHVPWVPRAAVKTQRATQDCGSPALLSFGGAGHRVHGHHDKFSPDVGQIKRSAALSQRHAAAHLNSRRRSGTRVPPQSFICPHSCSILRLFSLIQFARSIKLINNFA